MVAPITQKQQLDAAWTRLKTWANTSMPAFLVRLNRLIDRLS